MGKKGRSFASTGEDPRSAAEIKAEIETQKAEAPAQDPTPVQPEPETQPEVSAPAPEDDRPKYDDSTGLPLLYESVTEPSPETAASEPEAKPKIGTFKTPEAVFDAYDSLRRVYDKEQNENRDLKGELQSLREQMAEIRGGLNAMRQPEPEPRAPEPTQEQLAEWVTENPAAYARWVEERAVNRAEARVGVIEEQLETERATRIQRERADFALRAIPEIRAVAEARGDESKMERGHIEFVQRYTTLIQQFPDMAQSNEKMEMAANAVRQKLYQERTEADRTRPARSAAKPPQSAKEDVYLESASGRAATTPKAMAANMTASEIRRKLIESGMPVIDRG